MYGDMDGFDWDRWNQNKNWVKHEVTVRESEEIFFNSPLKIARDPKHSIIEKRYSSLGKTDKGRLLAVFFTLRGSKIRIISARDQSRKERKTYEKSK